MTASQSAAASYARGFVTPIEEHQFANTGHHMLRFVSLIPLLEDG